MLTAKSSVIINKKIERGGKMSLTREDLKAISDLIDVKLDKQEQNSNKRFDEVDKRFSEIDKRFDEQDKKIDKKLDDLRTEFKEMLIDNTILIAEHVKKVVLESEERLSREIQEIRNATAQNSYDIAVIKQKIS